MLNGRLQFLGFVSFYVHRFPLIFVLSFKVSKYNEDFSIVIKRTKVSSLRRTFVMSKRWYTVSTKASLAFFYFVFSM